jgi:hypothetical protein
VAIKTFDTSNIKKIIYDPDEINDEINNPSQKFDKNLSNIGHALYKKYLYQLMILEFMEYFDSERNRNIRGKMEKLLSSINLRDPISIQTIKKEITEIISINSDVELIFQLLDNAQKHFDRKILLKQFNSINYQFDSESINQIREAIKKEKQEKKNILDIIKNISDKIITTTQPKEVSFIGIPQTCQTNPESKQCSRGKLYIESDTLKHMLSIFVDDILNPLKREYLLSTTFQFKVFNKFNFKKFPGERIYTNL